MDYCSILHKKPFTLKKTSKHIIALFTLLLFLNGSYLPGQTQSLTKTDSLRQQIRSSKGIEKVNSLIELSKQFWDSHPDSAIYYSELALQEAKKDGSNDALGDAYNSLGNAWSVKGQPEKALELYLKSKEYREKTENYEKIGNSYHNIGILHRDQKRFNQAIASHLQASENYEKAGKYRQQAISYRQVANIYNDISDKNKALEFAFKSLAVINANNLDDMKASVYNLIGSLHRELKNIELAEKFYKLAFDEWNRNNDLSGLSTSYNNLGIIYDEKGELQRSLEYYNKSLEIAIQLTDSSGMATAYNNIGFTYARINEPNKAISAYEKSLEISKKTGNTDAYFNTLNNIAAVNLKIKRLNEAQRVLNLALKEISKVKDLAYKQETYQLLSELHAQKGDYRQAYLFKSKELAYADTLYTQQRISSIAEMQTRYDTEAKEKEIQLLRKDVELKELQYQKQKSVQQVLVSLTLLLVVIFIGTILVLYIIRKKNQQLAQKNKELNEINEKLKRSEKNLSELNATKDKLFSIIAHDLKNPFNALIGFSDILERNYSYLTDNEKKEYIAVISESSQNLYKLLDNLLQWTRAQTGSITYIPERFRIDPLIKQEIQNLSASAEKKKISITVDAELNQMVFADKNSIATVIRNLISNAIKFTDVGGKIEITAKLSEENPQMAEVIVKDSGVGIDPEDLPRIFMIDGSFSTRGTANESGTGLGLLLCHDFVVKNNGKIWVNSTKGSGSAFHFTIPLA